MYTIPRCPVCGKNMKWVGRAQCSGEGGVMGIDYFRCHPCGEQDTILLSGRDPRLLPVIRQSEEPCTNCAPVAKAALALPKMEGAKC